MQMLFTWVFLIDCGGFASCDSGWNQLHHSKFSKKIKEFCKNKSFLILKLSGEYRPQGKQMGSEVLQPRSAVVQRQKQSLFICLELLRYADA